MSEAERATWRVRAATAQSMLDQLYKDGTLSYANVFSSSSAAAKHVLGAIGPISLSPEVGLEIGGFLFNTGENWSYAVPMIGLSGSMPQMVNVPAGAGGGYHTHPGSGSANFSINDTGWVAATKMPLYVWGSGEIRVCKIGAASCNFEIARRMGHFTISRGRQGEVVP